MSDNKKPEKDKFSGVETTGHEWDGIKELNNPAPRWWLLVFIICIIWSVGYWVVYPAWPTIEAHTKGAFGWTTKKELAESQKELLAIRGKFAGQLSATPLADISKDPQLFEYARQAGLAAFKQNCAACHGSGGQGGKGFPNLNDDDWLWGGKLDEIHTTLRVGIRSTHKDTRVSQMPSFGRDGILKHEEIEDVASYVEQLNKGDKAEQTEARTRGAKIFADNCAACHGNNGEGGRSVGAPRLNDAIWLYGGDKKSIVESITNAHAGVMPSWEGRLDDDTIKALAIYVHSLGGGEK